MWLNYIKRKEIFPRVDCEKSVKAYSCVKRVVSIARWIDGFCKPRGKKCYAYMAAPFYVWPQGENGESDNAVGFDCEE